MHTQPSPDQQAAIDAAIDWFQDPWRPNTPFTLFGAAGTGKTFIAAQIQIALTPYARYLAPTHKAAQVLRDKSGGEGPSAAATTIQSGLYYWDSHKLAQSKDCLKRADGTTDQSEAASLRAMAGRLAAEARRRRDFTGVGLLVVDEASMIDETMAKDLTATGVPVLAIGDPHQLPPVNGEPGYPAERVSAMLATQHRSGDSVIDLALDAQRDPDNLVGELLVPEDLDLDVLLAYSNMTVSRLNYLMRLRRGFEGPIPDPGEILLARSNDATVQNGQTYQVISAQKRSRDAKFLDLVLDDGAGQVAVRGVVREVIRSSADLSKAQRDSEHSGVALFQFGYAMTAHSAQGSEWDSVGVVVDKTPVGSADKWLYTAITRAKTSVKMLSAPDSLLKSLRV